MRTHRPLVVLIALTAGLGLAGCASSPIEKPVEGTTEKVVEEQTKEEETKEEQTDDDETGDKQTGGDTKAADGGSSANLPEDWPGLPVPEGKISAAMGERGLFYLTITVSSEAEIERVIAELVSQGYEETLRATTSGTTTVALETSDTIATFAWLPYGATGGFSLTYTVGAQNKK